MDTAQGWAGLVLPRKCFLATASVWMLNLETIAYCCIADSSAAVPGQGKNFHPTLTCSKKSIGILQSVPQYSANLTGKPLLTPYLSSLSVPILA